MATTVTYADLHVADDVAHALTAGLSESTVDSQMTKAITVLTAKTANTANEGAALTNAIALLNAAQAHVRDPKNH